MREEEGRKEELLQQNELAGVVVVCVRAVRHFVNCFFVSRNVFLRRREEVGTERRRAELKMPPNSPAAEGGFEVVERSCVEAPLKDNIPREMGGAQKRVETY